LEANPTHKGSQNGPHRQSRPALSFLVFGNQTAVLRYVELHNLRPEAEARREALFTGPDAPPSPTVDDALATCDLQTLDLIASFQHAVVGDLMKKTFAAQESLGVLRISSPAESPPIANCAPASPPKPPAATSM